jgi:hypothetical protein
MRSKVSMIAAIVAILAAGAGAAAADPPDAGVLVLGRSLGGVGLGMTVGQVEARWGHASRRCRSCPRPTLLFNSVPFRPEGAAVELAAGRVSAVYTLWAPAGWHTAEGVQVGESATEATAVYGPLGRVRCKGYYGLTIRSAHAVNVVYVVGTDVWGLGLLRRGANVCR